MRRALRRLPAYDHVLVDGQKITGMEEHIGPYTPIVKGWLTEMANEITSLGIQVHGGMGYSKELPLERYFRDAKITEIYEGTSDVQRMVISRAIAAD